MPQTETPVSQLKINELTKTQFESASDLSETEIYAVDPQFTGGKLLKTDSNGDIIESTATEAEALAGGTAIQGVQVNGSDLTPDTNKKVNVQVPTNNNQLTNGAGYITSSALNGYATQTWVGQQGYLTSTALNGYATEQWVGQQGYLTSITSSDVTTALGYTPYNSTNPAGYTSNVGTVTSVNNVSPVNGNVSLTIPTVNNATLTIQKNGSNVATFTANSSTNQTANITVPTDNADLTNGAGYITGITGSDVTTALGYTPLQSSDILNVVDSTATNKALSANMGKELQDQIENLKARGRYLALWNCATGLAQSNPTQSPYNYQTGDYFIIGTVATGSGTNYRPNGSSYTTGVASTTVETEPVAVNDVYYYDGTNWSLQINTQKEVTFSSVGGSPYDNSNLASALNGKQAELVSGTNIKTINNNSILGSGNLSIDSLPSQSGQNGKYLKTNGTSASWSTLDLTGYATEQWVGQQGYITGITSSDVTSALGYTPYNSSNPNGYTSNVGTVTSVNNVQPVNGNVTISIPTQVTENTVSGWGFTKNLGTVTSVNNVSPTNGNVTLSIPTDTSDLTNSAGFITSSALSGYQTTSNLVTSVSSASTDSQYPSAKLFYDETESIKSGYVQRLSTSSATGSTSQGVYVDSNGKVQTCDAVTSTYVATDTAPVNGVAVSNAIATKQDNLVSGTNIKTINGNSLLGSGNIVIETSSTPSVDGTTISYNSNDSLQTIGVINKNGGTTLPIWQGTEFQWNQGISKTWYYWSTAVTPNWTTTTIPSASFLSAFSTIAVGNGKLVALGGSNQLAISIDNGETWTAQTNTVPIGSQASSMTYGNNMFLCNGGTNSSSYNYTAYSTDGINWSSASTLPSNGSWKVVFYNGVFIAFKSDQIVYSSDPSTTAWQTATIPANTTGIVDCAYGNGVFVAICDGKSIYSIDNGITWNNGGTLQYNYFCIDYGNGRFVALSRGATTTGRKSAYSLDGGITWVQGIWIDFYAADICFGENKFVAITDTNNSSAYSLDGETWVSIYGPSIGSSTSIGNLVYNNGRFIAVFRNLVSTNSAYLEMSSLSCFTETDTPTESSYVYSEPNVLSQYSITSVSSGAITLSDNNTYYYNQSGNQYTYQSIGAAHPDWLCFINGVGVKIGTITIATA